MAVRRTRGAEGLKKRRRPETDSRHAESVLYFLYAYVIPSDRVFEGVEESLALHKYYFKQGIPPRALRAWSE